jgi:hypothetical protein
MPSSANKKKRLKVTLNVRYSSVTLNLKNWQTKVTNNFDTHVTFSLENFINKPPHSITTDEIPRWWWTPIQLLHPSTTTQLHQSSFYPLLHRRHGSNIGSCALSASDPVVSASGQQCLDSGLLKGKTPDM